MVMTVAYNHVVKVAMQQEDLLNCVMFLDKAASDSIPSIWIFYYFEYLKHVTHCGYHNIRTTCFKITKNFAF
jgi:hypothetical protein